VGNNVSNPIEFRQLTAADFARLRPSLRLTLVIIRRAQMSSRKAIVATAKWKKRHGDV
jgi:hypothetical protein